jgi:hypothetical protein
MIIKIKPVETIPNQIPFKELKEGELGFNILTKKLYIGLKNGFSQELLTGTEINPTN